MTPLPKRLSSTLALVGVEAGVWRLLVARSLRGFCDGYIAVLLPAYLQALGMSILSVGLISPSTLLGSAIATMLIGMLGNRFSRRSLLLIAALVMTATGVGFSSFSTLWPLLVVAFLGTMNPSAGDVSMFLPIEHAYLRETPHELTTMQTALRLDQSSTDANGFVHGAPRVCLAEDKADRQHLPLQHVSDLSLPRRASRFDYESGDLDRLLLADFSMRPAKSSTRPSKAKTWCSGQLIPDTTLNFSLARISATPPLN